MNDPYDIRVLQPESISLSRGAGGVMQGVVDGKPYSELIVFRTFPFLYTTQYLSIRDAKGEELGIVTDLEELDAESRDVLRQELRFRYFLPRVTRVDSVKQKTDLWIWELQTDLGPTRLAMRNLHDHMQFPGGSRIILTDLTGKRCEIQDWKKLDGHSRKQLNDVI
ncbi:hypothetical protein IJ21_46710 [Paenibacillus sp. 32O-W]|jgi:Domain of unknown function (DUF1854).|uniref:DUF1854 domain-containing protein n=1 Tax=Paenibacillus sp. 32O-W TaxID=1695218 RepID=UPI00072177E5|nr:DUF1854 domain-containing protein [Paenibacillus sp. 32O-W]ALS30033.1 hypothetical protein IJ21_46710 [Paenibacillus sp. 32O-W]